MAITQARLPEGAPLIVSDDTTFRQLLHVDTQQAAMKEAQTTEQQLANAEYRLVHVNIQDVSEAMQLKHE
ncbi:hypothetical protein PF005_g23378 [Phytophthora fragariae]|uniref:Uncharacterized protein n=1 Tax=Phytophthora fragariae TaxID=53985 RepID=A0A6A3EAW7_9STRA|nr:hypothetical protein PF003_g6658 [Phytophthora fragariae]KAE8929623.1 hypothetical protein PF009_g20264 [Phytophthora fragariae]KAE8989299.1 hypothetical protein PF011_g18830 [Phytophthora fragariae]KAE9081848.1 hypothetical protein PF007_g22507 [Phytophthora fragariae]KAE9084550.1 hypothetical protein PF010_g20782 [Phytophthora fragariae]